MEKRYYVEVELKEDFLVVVETLTRIGILQDTTLNQTCHLFHNKGKYYVTHFMELFSMMDFKCNNKVDISRVHMMDEDFERRNTIIFLLTNWNLIKPLDIEYIINNKGSEKVFVVPHKDKNKYVLKSNFKL